MKLLKSVGRLLPVLPVMVGIWPFKYLPFLFILGLFLIFGVLSGDGVPTGDLPKAEAKEEVALLCKFFAAACFYPPVYVTCSFFSIVGLIARRPISAFIIACVPLLYLIPVWMLASRLDYL
ncbi:hypothetical protein [Rhodopirellula islandica]|nr:hypothetical protein [Rhodopirellula islandica]